MQLTDPLEEGEPFKHPEIFAFPSIKDDGKFHHHKNQAINCRRNIYGIALTDRDNKFPESFIILNMKKSFRQFYKFFS